MINLRKNWRALRSRIPVFFNKKSEKVPIPGTPPSLEFDLLNQVCLEVLSEPLQKVSYTHLSGWKSSGAFRVFIETKGNTDWSLIYKNAVYDYTDIPALSGLPIRPGPPEYLLYSKSRGNVAKYLPRVFHLREVVAGLHYQYLLEDLVKNYRVVDHSNDLLIAAKELPAIQRAIREWFKVVRQDDLLFFDSKFHSALIVYIDTNLQKYLKQTKNVLPTELVKCWSEIVKFYESLKIYDTRQLSPIHGDFNLTNFLINKECDSKLKVIDWEWAGVGIPAADLASLLKVANIDVEEQALKLYCQNYSKQSIKENAYLYHSCKLERGLFDASFFAKQYFESGNVSRINIHKHIQAALVRVVSAYKRLCPINKIQTF